MTEHSQENRRLWNEWSDDFQALWNADTDNGELPPTPSPFEPEAPGGRQRGILTSVEGKDYVELGCGGGQAAVGTAERGAETVVGVDFSGEQLRHARQLREFCGVDVQFVTGDVTDLPLADDRFDIASSEWAFQMVEHLDQALDEAHRVLRDGGVFVLSAPHPVYETLDTDRGIVDGNYFDIGPRKITIDEDYESTLTVFDRTVADLHNGLVDAGFAVRRIIEHRQREVEENQPSESDLPEILWNVPKSVRFWAVAE
ncbi:methyltransferase domain-containing protein [Natronorubrum sp. JWXQ-INN-674]|uniref:Methyltransferase domain-containing protein n=1 Tax=Natronorubrum halalkaliphilum TaxID=2691917 RepID=A0A6B0VNQ0_9EURY|nr:class I SAM-dependent methyltransferase [Natronorubrum halalkaliphilum]MXV62596.1 methyltransferase domain-containing protein [Natronorubrum halalkaliphilum]